MSFSILSKFNKSSSFVVVIQRLLWFKVNCFLIEFNCFFKILLFIFIVAFIFSIFSWICLFWWLFFFRSCWFRLCLFFWRGNLFLHFLGLLFTFTFSFFELRFLLLHIFHKFLEIKISRHSSFINYIIGLFNFWIILEHCE